MSQRLSLLLAALCAVATTASAATNAIEDHGRIRSAAESHAAALAAALAPPNATVRVMASRLDPRLRLAACPGELETFSPAGQMGMPSSVGVRCTRGLLWSLYVPVNVEVVADVVVLVAGGQRGARLSAEDLRLEPRDIGRMTRGYLAALEAAEGMVLKRQLQPGTVLEPGFIEHERVVRRGERVRLNAGGGLLAVSMEGEAMADAAAGERVKVRNLSSGQIVEGTARASGQVDMAR